MKTQEEIFKALVLEEYLKDNPEESQPDFDKDWYAGGESNSPEANRLRSLVFRAMDQWKEQGPTNEDLKAVLNLVVKKLNFLIELHPVKNSGY